MNDKKEAREVYNKIAEKYHEKRISERDLNLLVDQPTIFALLGHIKGKKILDAGCGSGIYSRILLKKGAKVSGLEVSGKMLDLAREHCKKFKVDFKQGSVDKLPYPDKSFDIIVSSLVIHYLKNPTKAFKEFNRVLKKGGILVFSTHHPVFESLNSIEKKGSKKVICISDYFGKGKFYWKIYNSKVKIPSYRIGFEKLIDFIYNNGFLLEKLKEPYMSKSKFKFLKGTHCENFVEVPSFIAMRCRKVT